jgi:HEAT repeat protein
MKDAAAQGQEPLIMALCARLEDGDSAVQAAAVESLVALIDDSTRELAIREAISRCQRPGGHIREAAIQILGKIAERGDQRASEAAASLLDDQDDRVRAAAIDACGRVLTVKGHRQTVEKILKEISHTKAFVRRAVVDAVAVITEQRDTKGRDCLLQGCVDVSANVRKSAIVALMGRCNDGDNEALMTALNHLSEQEDHGVRRASAALLSKVARSSDKNAMDAVISFLGEEDDSIRGSGLQAMERFCTGNMARGVLSRIISLLEHHRAATRTEISEFLSNIFAQREDVKNDVLEVCKMLDNRSNFNTRRVAADTLKKAAAKGSVNTVDAVSGLLNDANPQVRRMAVEILSAASQAGSEAAKLALTDAAAVEGSSDLVRQAAEEIMLKTGITGQDPSMGLFSPKTGPKK